jgi:hypothetical protein
MSKYIATNGSYEPCSSCQVLSGQEHLPECTGGLHDVVSRETAHAMWRLKEALQKDVPELDLEEHADLEGFILRDREKRQAHYTVYVAEDGYSLFLAENDHIKGIELADERPLEIKAPLLQVIMSLRNHWYATQSRGQVIAVQLSPQRWILARPRVDPKPHGYKQYLMDNHVPVYDIIDKPMNRIQAIVKARDLRGGPTTIRFQEES